MNVRCTDLNVDGEIVVTVAGSIDLATVATFRDHLMRTVLDNPGCIVTVDLDEVASLDDTALGVLLGMAGRARERAGDVRITCSQARLRQYLEQTGADRALEVSDRY